MNDEKLIAGLAQIKPIWMNKKLTIEKICAKIKEAGVDGCGLVCFGEAAVPGYPFWLSVTGGASFNSKIQKEIFSRYYEESVQIEEGDLGPVCRAAAENKMAVYLGIIERALDRGGHSLYCSLVFINSRGEIGSVHRKLMPTYEERLVWGTGDGHGLRVHKIGKFTAGGLNCWENWMPLVRSSLYAQGEDLHVAVWPGSDSLTKDITRFIAREARSFVLSVSCLMEKSDIPDDVPHSGLMKEMHGDVIANGGTCAAAPDGKWIAEPVVNKEELTIVELDHNFIKEERQNFDLSGHYSRPDVTKLIINTERQNIIERK